MQILINFFASLPFFFVTSGVFLAITVYGGLFPMSDVFATWPFRVLTALVAVSLVACSIKRWQAIKNRAGILVTHFSVLLLFAGFLINGIYARQGLLPLEIGQKSDVYLSNDEKELPLPFEVLLKDFRILYWENERHIIHAKRKSDDLVVSKEVEMNKTVSLEPLPVSVTPLKYYPNFVKGNAADYSRDDSPQNPCLEITAREGNSDQKMLLFALLPDFHGMQSKRDILLNYEYVPGRIKQFESDIVIYEKGKEVFAGTVWVNKPFVWKGWKFFQSGYDDANLRRSIIQLSTDPGKYVFAAGFFLLLAGLAWAFLKPRKGENNA